MKAIALLGMLVMVSGLCASGAAQDPPEIPDLPPEALEDIEKAADADGVVKALNTFSDKMTALGPKMKKASEEMAKKAQSGKMPKEMEEMAKKSMEVVAKMRTIQEKMAKYATDPKVQAAQKKMMEAMAAMGK